MQTKKFTVEFYQVTMTGKSTDNPPQPSEFLIQLADMPNCPIINRDGYDFEIRGFQRAGKWIMGKFGKIRHYDIPHAATPGGNERELELENGEGLIEKNHFIYHTDLSLLVWQRNQHASSQVRFCEYLTEATGCHDTPFNTLPVIRKDAIQKLKDGGMHIRKLSIKVAASPNPSTTCATDFGRSTMQLLQTSGGMPVTLEISGNGRSKSPKERFIDHLRSGIIELLKGEQLESGKILLESDTGQIDTVDLFADRLKSSKPVEMIGRYPDERSIFSALREAWNEHREEIQSIIGN